MSALLSITPFEIRAPPHPNPFLLLLLIAAGDSDISGTREVKHRGGGGGWGDRRAREPWANRQALATDSFRKTQTPWNEELRIKL